MLLTIALFTFFIAVFLTLRNFLYATDDTTIAKVLWWTLTTALYIVSLLTAVLSSAL